MTGCQVIVSAGLGNADPVAEDKDNNLALLGIYGVRKLSSLALATDAKRVDVTLVGIPIQEQNGAKKLIEIKARLTEGNAIELRQPVPMAGFSGAAAIDPQGRFLGMMMEMRARARQQRLYCCCRCAFILRKRFVIFWSHNVAPTPAGGGPEAFSVVRIILAYAGRITLLLPILAAFFDEGFHAFLLIFRRK